MKDSKPAIKSTTIVSSIVVLISTSYLMYSGQELDANVKFHLMTLLTTIYSIYTMIARKYLTDKTISGLFRTPDKYLLIKGSTVLGEFPTIIQALDKIPSVIKINYTIIDVKTGETILELKGSEE